MDEWNRERRPLVGQVRDSIWNMLKEEGYQPWDRLPSEQELASRFGVSRGALREALRVLEEERTILCQHGVGRFVAPEPPGMYSEDITHLMSTSELARSLNINFSCNVISAEETQPDEQTRGFLGLAPGERIVCVERVWLSLDGPMLYSIDKFPRSLLHEPPTPALFSGSLLALLERDSQRRLDYSKTTIRAVLLSGEQRARIGKLTDIPWILLEQVNYDAKGVPFLYSRDYHGSDKFQFRVLRHRR